MSAPGYLTDAELAPIDNGQRLAKAAAPSYLAMLAAAYADGVTIRTTEGYRDYATSAYLYDGWIRRLPGFNPASPPGESPHNIGYASDLNTSGFGGTVYDWLSANAGRFGFNNIVGRSIGEPWHWVYDGTGSAGLGSSAFPNVNRKDIEMRLFHQVFTNGNQAFVCSTELADFFIGSDDMAALEKALGIQRVQVNEYDWDAYSRAMGKHRAALAALVDSTLDDEQAEMLAAIRSAQGGGSGGGGADPTAIVEALVKALPTATAKLVLDGLAARIQS